MRAPAPLIGLLPALARSAPGLCRRHGRLSMKCPDRCARFILFLSSLESTLEAH